MIEGLAVVNSLQKQSEQSSDLNQEEVPGEEKHVWKASEKCKALATFRSFGNSVCVYLKPQFGLLFEKVSRG